MAAAPLPLLILIALAGLFVVLLASRWRGVRIGVGLLAVLLVFGAAGLLLLGRLVTRECGRPGYTRTPLVVACKENEEACVEATVRTGDDSCIVTTDISGLPDAVQDLLGDAPRESLVRFENNQLIVAGYTVLQDQPSPPTAPGPPPVAATQDGDRERAKEQALHEVIRREVAGRLDRFFKDLLADSTAAPKLQRLRSKLKQLSSDERRRLASRVAKLQEVVDRYEIVSTRDPETDRVLKYQAFETTIDPDDVEQLVLATVLSNYRQPPDRTWTRVLTVLTTVGVVIAAAVVLKAATRRHIGARQS